MSSWLTRDAYVPLWVLATGLMAFAGALGAGRLLLRGAGTKLPPPWDTVTAELLGLQVLSLGVQLLAMASLATRSALCAWLAAFAIAGAFELVRGARRLVAWRDRPTNEPPVFWAVAALVAMALTVNLILAVAPSTKLDELAYHMLVPSRIVHDHLLRFYLEPAWGAALPQMGFQIAAAPLHAAGVPDAPNVVSWALSATLVWFFYRLIRNAGHARVWAAGWCAVVAVGMYGAVWWVTGGAHAMGDLAVAALVVAVIAPESLRPPASDRTYAVTIGILASAGAMTKVSLIPLTMLLFAAAAANLRRPRVGETAMLWVTALLPVVLLWGPLVAWTWQASGAPLGPFYSWWFPDSVYAGTAIRESMARTTMAANDLALRQSPVLWIGALAAAGAAALSVPRRAFAGALLLGQSALILALLTLDTRFLSGLLYGLAALFALAPPAWARRWGTTPPLRRLVLLGLVVPWAIAPLYYARPFARVVFGADTPDRFRERYVAYYADYRILDTLLPAEAVLLADYPMSAVYAPRPPVFSLRDAPPHSPVYQFAGTCEPQGPSLVGSDTLYFSRAAKASVFRTPGRAPELAPLCVRRLVPRTPRPAGLP